MPLTREQASASSCSTHAPPDFQVWKPSSSCGTALTRPVVVAETNTVQLSILGTAWRTAALTSGRRMSAKIAALNRIVAQFTSRRFDYPKTNLGITNVVRIEIDSVKGKTNGFA